MVSHPELGIDPPIGSDRESGRDTCVIIYAIIYGLSVVGPKMAMDFSSTKWNRC